MALRVSFAILLSVLALSAGADQLLHEDQDESPLIQTRRSKFFKREDCPPLPEECAGSNPTICVYIDPLCSTGNASEGGLGCNSNGQNQSCRYCGGAGNVPCPKADCPPRPAKCGGNPSVCIFLDLTCISDGGVGCNADGVNEDCRYCGEEPDMVSCPTSETPTSSEMPTTSETPTANGTTELPETTSVVPTTSVVIEVPCQLFVSVGGCLNSTQCSQDDRFCSKFCGNWSEDLGSFSARSDVCAKSDPDSPSSRYMKASWSSYPLYPPYPCGSSGGGGYQASVSWWDNADCLGDAVSSMSVFTDGDTSSSCTDVNGISVRGVCRGSWSVPPSS